jgi:Flp pilus assembly pilin Flp
VANQVLFTEVTRREVHKVNYLRNFLNDERGAELAEYAVGTAILVAVAIICYRLLGDAVNIKMSTVANEVQK